MKPVAHSRLSRREALLRAGVATGALLTSLRPPTAAAQEPAAAKTTFVFCLNSATIRGQKLGLVKEIETAAQAGYQAIEPWVSSIDEYKKAGGSLADLRKRIADLGLTVESSIGFPEWIVDDDARRAKGLERAKLDMDLVAQIGGKRVAAPPSGATNTPGLDLQKAAERYRALLELGDQMGVQPELEMWGFSKNLFRLSQVLFVAAETGHPKACVLPDIYHMHKGGSDFNSLKLCSAAAVPVFHMNDFPAEPPRDKIGDGDRIFPGDGVAPNRQILRDLNAAGGRKVLSLELFNKTYWQMDPVVAARTGLEKMKAAVQQALG
jgi:sugar phosphate isomerase/epimerase